MAGSFVENVNLLARKLPIIEESNEIFDEGVIPVLEEIAALDLEEAIIDLKKGNYLGNRKIDINLILNMLDVDETLIERDPEQAEAIWTDVNKAVHYDKAIVTFVDGEVIAGTIGKQKDVYTAQTKGFKDSALQSLAKTMIDTWSVRRSTDEGTTTTPESKLYDGNIGNAIEAMFANLQVPVASPPPATPTV